jgi:hypothetical protein
MLEAQQGEDVAKPEGSPEKFHCDFCKQPIESLAGCFEVPLCIAYPELFTHRVASGNPVRFHNACWATDAVQSRVAADLRKHKADCSRCAPPTEPEPALNTQEANDGRGSKDGDGKTSPKLTEDSQGLGVTRTGSYVIGHVDEIVGQSGVAVPGFVATKFEVLQIAKYWATEIVDLDFDYFLYGCTGSSEWRRREFADRRLNTISKFIGTLEVRVAFREAEQAFAKGIDPRTWKIFTEGTKEEQERFQREVQQELARDSEGGK